MEQREKKFAIDYLNTDDAPHVLPEGAAVQLQNMRVHRSKDGKTGYYDGILGNLVLTGQDVKIPANSERIASYEDPAGAFAVWFTHVSGRGSDDQINFYDFKKKQLWIVAKDTMGALGTIEGGLNFQFGYFYDIEVVNGIIYWTSPDQRPRKIHIGAGIKSADPAAAFTTDIPFYNGWKYDWVNTGDDDTSNKNLSFAAKPPAYPPLISKKSDPSVGSLNLTGESFQFATRYRFHTNEYSSLSFWSEPSLINSEAQRDLNVIDVTINPLEFPTPQGLKEMILYVKVFSTQKVFEITRWKASDLTAGNPVSFSFYGYHYGPALDQTVVAEPYHSVPRNALTIDAIKNRIIMGNCLEGYDTPQVSSFKMQLGAPITIVDISATNKAIQYVMYRGTHKTGGLTRPRFYYSGLYVKLESVPVPGYYLIPGTEIRWNAGFTGVPAVFSAPPTTVALGSLVFKGTNITEIIEATRSWTIAQLYESYIRESTTVTISVTGLIESNARTIPAFLHGADYIGATAFYDRWMQKCSVVGKRYEKVSIPVRDFGLTTAYNNIGYTYSNADALNEIPEWAEYYAPLLGRNSRTSSFIEGMSTVTRYARIDPTTGDYKYDDGKEDTDPLNDDSIYLSFSGATAAIGIDQTSLVSNGLGYVYTEGDICILIAEDNKYYYLPVLGQDGKFIRLGAKDIGDLTGKLFAFCIYTPYKADLQDYFFEVGQLFPVSNAGTDNRQYSTISGNFKPDAWVIDRKNADDDAFQAYAMSPNDLFWRIWVNYFGRVNTFLELGEQRKTSNLSYGDKIIPGSSVNGITAFHAISETNNIPPELGPIRKIICTSRASGEGSILLVICEAGIASVYIEESRVFDDQGNSILAQSKNVIADINPLEGAYGTTHPESVKEMNGQVFGWSQAQMAYWRYDVNGIFPISEYKFVQASIQLAKVNDQDVSTGKKVMMNGGIDTFFKEYLTQRKVYGVEIPAICELPQSFNVEHSPTLENPERYLATWEDPAANGVFVWQLYDQNNNLVQFNNNFTPGVANIEVEITGILIGQSYRFDLYRKCGGNSISRILNGLLYVPGITPPPDGDCVKPTIYGVPDEYEAQIGFDFLSTIEITGTGPFTMSDIVAPSWLTIALSGRTVTMSGIPPVESEGSDIPISFKIENCAGPTNALIFSNSITVSL